MDKIYKFNPNIVYKPNRAEYKEKVINLINHEIIISSNGKLFKGPIVKPVYKWCV